MLVKLDGIFKGSTKTDMTWFAISDWLNVIVVFSCCLTFFGKQFLPRFGFCVPWMEH